MLPINSKATAVAINYLPIGHYYNATTAAANREDSLIRADLDSQSLRNCLVWMYYTTD